MKNVIFFTGAGVSAESGVRTFRGNGGMWDEYRVEDVATAAAWKRNKSLVLEFYNKRRSELNTVEPNAAHVAIGELQKSGKFNVSVITQNVDDLHERGGAMDILHLHGELLKSRSSVHRHLKYVCNGDINIGDKCEKGTQLRPDIVMFNEDLDEEVTNRARRLAKEADYFVIVGTSMLVQPAASIPFLSGETTRIYYVDPGEMSGIYVPEYRREYFMHVMANATTGVAKVIEQITSIENGRQREIQEIAG